MSANTQEKCSFVLFLCKKNVMFVTDILLEKNNPHKLCFIYEINQAKKQGLALHRLKKCEIQIWFLNFFD